MHQAYTSEELETQTAAWKTDSGTTRQKLDFEYQELLISVLTVIDYLLI
jgi:hypothetical protein